MVYYVTVGVSESESDNRQSDTSTVGGGELPMSIVIPRFSSLHRGGPISKKYR
jgi:hypothetical protein